MSHGGKRPGAGRKPGSANTKTREIADKAAEEGLMPLEYMLRVLRDEMAPTDRRDWAAEKAAPFCHAKLSSVDMKADVKHTHEDWLDQLEDEPS